MKEDISHQMDESINREELEEDVLLSTLIIIDTVKMGVSLDPFENR